MRPPAIPTCIPINKDDSKDIATMKQLYNCLIEYKEPKTNRSLILAFMSLPSRKGIPGYYTVIAKPIAMNKIRDRIEKKLYPNLSTIIDDFKLMFENCKFFNEDGSQIYEDVIALEQQLFKRYEELKGTAEPTPTPIKQSPVKAASPVKQRKSPAHVVSSPVAKTVTTSTTVTAPTAVSSVDSTPTKKVDIITSQNEHSNEASMDSNSNLSMDLINSTPIEKCSLNTRRGRNSDAPKRQLLTGYIIYASEIRKKVIDENPNQNFGDISRLVGNEWKALAADIRSKYDQRALIHNKRVREKALRELGPDGVLPAGLGGDSNKLAGYKSGTPKMTKRKLARLAKEQMRRHHLSFNGMDDSAMQSPGSSRYDQANQSGHMQGYQNQAHPSTMGNSSNVRIRQPYDRNAMSSQHAKQQLITKNSSTQTNPIRFVEPPPRKRLAYSDSFKKYIESFEGVEKLPDKPVELPTSWLGAGLGRYRHPETALWALRNFMLQDADEMRRSIEPYMATANL